MGEGPAAIAERVRVLCAEVAHGWFTQVHEGAVRGDPLTELRPRRRAPGRQRTLLVEHLVALVEGDTPRGLALRRGRTERVALEAQRSGEAVAPVGGVSY